MFPINHRPKTLLKMRAAVELAQRNPALTVAALARAVATSSEYVKIALAAAGVEAAAGDPWRLNHIRWSRVGLGVKTDTEIARELGCSYSAVRGQRIRRGIERAPRRERWYL